MAANVAMNVAVAAAKNPAVQQGVRDVAVAAAGGTMDKLVQKEREMKSRMENLKERQQQVLAALESLKPNWPGHFLCISPVVYHNIEKAIPGDRISYVKASYSAYFFTIFLIFYNIACCAAGIIAQSKDENDQTPYGAQLGVSCIHLLGIPGAFIVWHFQVYKAVQPRGPLSRYGTAYLGLVIAFLFNAFMALGLIGYGGAGFFYALKLKDKKQSEVTFWLSLVCAIFWLLQAVYFGFSGFRLRKYHREDKAAQNPVAAAVGKIAGMAGMAAAIV